MVVSQSRIRGGFRQQSKDGERGEKQRNCRKHGDKILTEYAVWSLFEKVLSKERGDVGARIEHVMIEKGMLSYVFADYCNSL